MTLFLKELRAVASLTLPGRLFHSLGPFVKKKPSRLVFTKILILKIVLFLDFSKNFVESWEFSKNKKILRIVESKLDHVYI